MWSSKPGEGLAACIAKRVPSFVSYFKSLGIGPVPGIEFMTSSAVKDSITRCTLFGNNVKLTGTIYF